MSPRRLRWQWAWTTALALVLTVVAHEIAHKVVAAGLPRFTPDSRSWGTLAGPAMSFLIALLCLPWALRASPGSLAQRWAIALGATAAVRLLFVWVIALPYLLRWVKGAVFDELKIAGWWNIPVAVVLAVETIAAGAAVIMLFRTIPQDHRREAAAGAIIGFFLTGLLALVLNPQV